MAYRIKIRQGDLEIEVEGDEKFVEKHIEELKGELQKFLEEPMLAEGSRVDIGEKKGADLDTLSIAEFYKQKQPKDHNETVVVFAYWLTKKEQKEEFTPKDISTCYDSAKVSRPKNIHQHIQRAAGTKKAWLMPGSEKGRYKLTITGEEFVENELPHKGGKE